MRRAARQPRGLPHGRFAFRGYAAAHFFASDMEGQSGMTLTMRGLTLLMIGALGAAGCDRPGTPGSPSAPSPVNQPPSPEQPLPTAGAGLAGSVSDAAGRPLVGATVEAIEGADAGRSAVTDAVGEFRLGGTFDRTTRFRASKEGHAAQVEPLPPACNACNPHWWINFSLESLAPHADISGNYTLTFVASAVCSALPEAARTRTYDATVARMPAAGAQPNPRFSVTVSSPPALRDYRGFTVGLAGNHVGASLGDFHETPGFAEQIAPDAQIGFGGSVKASVDYSDVSTISAILDGVIDYCEFAAPSADYQCNSAAALRRARCESTDHRLTLTRR
jgi:hypothetical protein